MATRGLCADVLQLVLAEHELVAGETMLAELTRVLNDKLGVPEEVIEETTAFIRRQAIVVRTELEGSIKGLDRADSAIVMEAAAGAVDVLVTGDQGLLKVPGLPVKTPSPRDFWNLLRNRVP